jgi:hypothetical protein
MVEPELAAIVVLSLLLQQRARARVVQLTVVKHDEAWISDEIRPHVIVAWGVAHLVHGQVVRVLPVIPEEVVRTQHAQVGTGPAKPMRIAVDENVYLMETTKGG